MATKSETKGSSKSRSSGKSSNESQTAFGFGSGNTGVLVGAAMAGAAVGIAANVGRKLFVQFTSGATGDWFDALKTEHALTLAIFDKIEATDDKQTMMRSHLLMKLKYALTKHAIEEENVVYPALRQANSTHDADALTAEHGYVKTYLYELENMPKNSPEWLARVRDFRAMIEEHIRMEEEEVFPAFRKLLSDEQNARLSALMNKEGFKVA
ncbi:hemerythrin domain-containing protein [Sphingosinicella sp. BN140058]|uniref:hemerythrin domain-containing protein n=1 Tax=Sphingosinicella sp. BN140058 TaxID=1892855 RepID=UPI001012A3D0|nr:hemerythrin domain-containing protein [Sphingosinicella sp. BN140058]QAY79359.1 hemerythrin domain-containing protein [Sphingosinicella sp. BN140058]